MLSEQQVKEMRKRHARRANKARKHGDFKQYQISHQVAQALDYVLNTPSNPGK